MQIGYFALVVVVLCFSCFLSSIHARSLDCLTRGEGATVVRGRYWYTCVNGNLRKDGCLDNSGRKIKIGESYVENSYEMSCYISGDGRLHIKQSGCVINDQRYLPGETWSGLKFWYTCLKTSGYIVQEVSGCIVNGRRIKVNDRATSKSIVYECQVKTTGAMGLCSVGCFKNGRQYDIGESWDDNQFQYVCTTRGGYCHYEITACKQGGRVYQPAQQWTDNNVNYRCDVVLGGQTGKITRLNYYNTRRY